MKNGLAIRAITDSRDLLAELRSLFQWANELHMAYAWASGAKEKQDHWQALDLRKLERAIIGAQFCQTEPQVLRALRDARKLRVLVDVVGTFHPKVLYGKRGNRVRVLSGSSNLTSGGFGSNTELNFLIECDADELPAKDVLQFIDDQWYSTAAIIPSDAWLADYAKRVGKRRPPTRIPPTASKRVNGAVVSVNKPRGRERVAWRFWAASPQEYKGQYSYVIDAAVAYMVKNRLITFGFGAHSLAGCSDDWKSFQADSEYYKPQPQMFYFAKRMRKGDLVVLARNTQSIAAYGFLVDDELRYVDKHHKLNPQVIRLQNTIKKAVKEMGHEGFENMRNYRLVDRWRPFKPETPKGIGGRISGSWPKTMVAVPVAKALSWLGLRKLPLSGNPQDKQGADDGEE